jgi:predicted PurR-regulated permease PerM
MAGVPAHSRTSSVAVWILAAIATVWFLRAARALLIPIALAVLISYALEPIVAWLERRHVHRLIGSAATLLIVLAIVGGGAYTLRDDAAQLAEAVPKAGERAREFVEAQLGSGDALGRVTGAFGGSTSRADGEAAVGTSGQAAPSLVQRAVSGVLGAAGHLVVIMFLVFFLLLSKHQVRDRVVEVAGPNDGQRRVAATIIEDINTQIQRYLLVLLCTGAIVGVATWLALTWIGAQHALMWGLLAGVFNCIPYFGPVIVSGGLFVVGLVQGGGINQALQMAGAAIVITSLEGWLVTPPLMGKVERMSALTVFLGLLFWTWVWGAWGTVLAVPMLAIIKSTADHVQRLRPVGRLMAP